ncbi:MAG: CusA/CzcA family heavy metal efflux RND transporter [Bryobacteraceae bacterium]|nr:CusA/CzcA family heavy metal efflux RND transporter [Bryobacteraceae bacterium]MDW8379327.1 CusA/CzcA family heavy metal efflux RND transporter [Bryobacterales bacterium]
MLARIVAFHLRNRLVVLAGLLILMGGGLYTLSRLPIDAFPDLTNNQVVVITESPGMPPSEVEQLVTYPIEVALMGVPRAQGTRSISKLGLSLVTVLFDDSTSIYFARQLINERLQEVRSRLPEGLEPTLGPVATAFGEVYQYTLESDKLSARELKTLHDWTIRNYLRSVRGVNEVNSWGGETRQIQVEVDPQALFRYNLSLRDVFERIRENNTNFGGGFIEHASEQYTIRGVGRVREVTDLEAIVLTSHLGTPVLLRNVAVVRDQAMQRQGAVTRDGRGETVSGMTIMLKGENGREVISRVKSKIATLALPEDVKIVPFYDQSVVIEGTIQTVRRNLTEAGALVIAVLFLFLGNWKAALIVACVIPLSMLVGFLGMAVFGVSANLMSLGALDFGMIVDGAVVMMENAVRRLERRAEDCDFDAMSRIEAAALEVSRPIVFGVGIIIAVYIPILALEGLEGRMFRPMAITVCSALLGSLALALTATPAAALTFLGRGVKPHSEAWFQGIRQAYVQALCFVLRRRGWVILAAVVLLAGALGSLAFIGTEFMPRLDEGSLLITTRKLPGIALSDSIALSLRVEKALLEFPEVTRVVTKLGRPDLATEAMGVYEGDVYVLLKPLAEWKTARNKNELVEKMAQRLEQIPGVSYNFTQPMAMRLDEVVSGIKADLALKIFGEDAAVLEQLAERALRVISAIPGAADAQMEVISGVAEIRVEADRAALARYGLNVADVRQMVEAAISGSPVSSLYEGQRRFDIVLRLPERYRQNPLSLAEVPLTAPGGERIRLGQVANLVLQRGPEIISRENAMRRIVVQSNVRGRDLGSFASEAQQKISERLKLPPGYSIDWGGQFENQERAMRRLTIVIPLSILIITLLLYSTFQSFRLALLILLNVPFALIGGVAALWLRGLNLNLSAAVGFIALFGVAVLNGIVLVNYINRLRMEGKELQEAIVGGAGTRLRPVLMTALVASLGFIPMALSSSTGAEVQRPLASVVIGGLFTSTLLTLFLLPALYPWFAPRTISSGTAPARQGC